MLAALFLVLALTRAEIIERFRAPAITKAYGFVQVFADCPADMRREFQMPVASFAAGVFDSLARAEGMKAPRFEEPGLIVHIGDVRTNVADVVVRVASRDDGAQFTRLYLPAPAYSDIGRFRLEIAKAFFLSVKGERLDDKAARRALVAADPVFKAEGEYSRVARWMEGLDLPEDRRNATASELDEECLRLARSVLLPGRARAFDVLRFASRLRLYPPAYDVPFCGRYRDCTFAQAVELAEREPRIRLAALEKAPFVVVFGGGRGEPLADASKAYSDFLFELARFKKPKSELLEMLDDADVKLNIALEEARKDEADDNGQPYRP